MRYCRTGSCFIWQTLIYTSVLWIKCNNPLNIYILYKFSVHTVYYIITNTFYEVMKKWVMLYLIHTNLYFGRQSFKNKSPPTIGRLNHPQQDSCGFDQTIWSHDYFNSYLRVLRVLRGIYVLGVGGEAPDWGKWGVRGRSPRSLKITVTTMQFLLFYRLPLLFIIIWLCNLFIHTELCSKFIGGEICEGEFVYRGWILLGAI